VRGLSYLEGDSDESMLARGNPPPFEGSTVTLTVGGSARLIDAAHIRGGLGTLVLTRQDVPTAAERAEAARAVTTQILGRIILGWPGVVEEVEVDWLSGTSIVLSTPNVSVLAEYPRDGDAAGWTTRLGAYVQPGARPAMGGLAVARRTVLVGDVAATDSSDLVPVPPRAHAVSLLLDDPTGAAGYGAVLLDHHGAAAGPAFATTAMYRTVPGDGEPHLLAEGVRNVRAVNLSASSARVVLVFHLVL
jgi:hypothetical protein